MKKRKTVKKRYVIALVIVIAGLITLWRILNAPVPTYQTLIVRPGDLQQSVLATGKLDALRKVDVGAQVSGQLKTLSVAIGDKVKKDQLLGVIDPEQAENQIKEVEATLMELRAQRQQAEAELKLARVTYSRQQRLAQTKAVSQQDLDTAAIVADPDEFEKLCRVIMVTEQRGMDQVDVLLKNKHILSDKAMKRIFEVVERDEPSHWEPYDKWLRANGRRPKATWREKWTDYWIHKSLILAKLPAVFVNRRNPRLTAWPDEDATVYA